MHDSQLSLSRMHVDTSFYGASRLIELYVGVGVRARSCANDNIAQPRCRDPGKIGIAVVPAAGSE